MRLSLQGILDPAYAKQGYLLPRFSISAMRQETLRTPTWVHLGAGNILRAFPAVLCQKLLDSNAVRTGLSVVECYDEAIVQQAFAPYDNLALAVSLKGDGSLEKRVVGSIAEAVGYSACPSRVEALFAAPSLQSAVP